MTTALAVVLAMGAAVAAAGCGRKKNPEMPPARGAGAAPLPALPEIAKGDEGDKTAAVSATEGHTTGTTFPRAESQIGPQAGGIISKIFVKEGDKVRRGMVLFRQDTGDAALRVQQAAAGLEAARVNLRATETESERTKAMFEQKAVNQMQWDQVSARLDGARVGVQQAEVALQMAKKMLADATVRSPLDGLVTAKLKNEGEMATMMPPTVVLVVQDQSVLELRFRVSERELADVEIGEQVTARFDALDVETKAKVVRINPTVDSRTRTVEAVAEIPNRDGKLRSGLLASVTVGAVPARPPDGDGPGAAKAPPAAAPAAPAAPTKGARIVPLPPTTTVRQGREPRARETAREGNSP